MEGKAVWTVTDASGEVQTPAPKKLLPHYKAIPITDDMTEGTRNFAEQFNAMRETLIEYKLMKAK